MTIANQGPKPSVRDRVFGPTEREKFLDSKLEAVEMTLGRILNAEENRMIDGAEGMGGGNYGYVNEALADIEMMIDAKGWSNVFEYDDNAGLTLKQVKDAAKQLRELLAGNPFVLNGWRVRTSHIHGAGMEISAKNRTNGKVKPLPVATQALVEEPRAQRYVFGNDAKAEMEAAAFTDGHMLILGEDSTKRMQRLSIHEITADLRNPDNQEEIWAYRRVWTRNPGAPDINQREKMTRWYYTDLIPLRERRNLIEFNSTREIVERGYTIIDKAFNRQVGWAYGVPDALAIIAWARLYREFLVNGYIMSRSLARFAYKVTVASSRAGQNASEDITLPGQAGSTAVEGQGNSLQAMSNAGKGYDFESGKSIAAAMAAGLGVSLLALLSDPASASGSNAAAQSLDGPARAMASMRRKSWEDFYVRLFRWTGLQQKIVITWHDLSDDTIQRIMQAWTLIDQLEIYGPEVIQAKVSEIMKIAEPGDVPAGWKPKSQRGQKPEDTTAGNGGATGGTDQGRGDDRNPDGGSQDDHDDD